MHLIEPCCAKKHLRELRDSIATGKSKEFKGYGDLSLTELLPAILMRYTETQMLIAAPSLPDQAAEIIKAWMEHQWARRDGKGKLDVVSHLTIVADLSEEQSPIASEWLKEKPFGERLTLVNTQQKDTIILLPDFAITGPVNMRYGYEFVATATTVAEEVTALWAKYKTPEDKPQKESEQEKTEETPREEPLKNGGTERRRSSARRSKSKDATEETAVDAD